MGDYTYTKPNLGGLIRPGQADSPWKRCEPLLTAEQLRMFHLFGIPLVSAIANPVTKKQDVITDPILKMYIERALAQAEIETGITIMPTIIEEKQAFDKPAYESMGFMMLKQKPVASVERLCITPANDIDVYNVPLEWLENGNMAYGQLNIIPLTLALSTGTVVPASTATGGSLFLSLFGYSNWIPAFWKVTYTAGFPDGKLPVFINDLIGTIAAMEVLSMLAATYSKSSSASLSLDGLSQSVGTPGPQLFKTRMEELEKKRQMLISKTKALFGLKLFTSHV